MLFYFIFIEITLTCCVPKLLISTTTSSLIYAFMRQGNDKIFSNEDSNHLLIQLHA